jgi:hypothetical protein
MRYAIAPKGNIGGATPAATTAPDIRLRITPTVTTHTRRPSLLAALHDNETQAL